jgi:hypothetical protein
MEAELTKQEHKNRPPKHAVKGPSLRLIARRRVIREIWKFRAEITNRSKAQTREVTASLMHKDNQIIWCRVLRRRVGVYTGRA